MRTEPGDCPICGMHLTPVGEGTTTSEEGSITLTVQQMRLGGIAIDSARTREIGEELHLTGTLTLDQERITTVSTRVMGRVDRIHAKTFGDRIHKGQPLYAIYSEDLNSAIAEMRSVARNVGTDAARLDELSRAVRNRLRAFGLSDARIAELAMDGEQPVLVDFPAPVDGIVSELRIREGERVMEGAAIMDVVSTSSLWLEAQVYPSVARLVEPGMEAGITFPARPEMAVNSSISFINPERAVSGSVGLVRFTVPDPEGLLQPGMQAMATLMPQRKRALVLPTDAVLRDGKGASVWLATDSCTFRNVMVTTGIESDGMVEIIEGIQPGDRIVVTGAYLVNSEFIFRKGGDPMQGMHH